MQELGGSTARRIAKLANGYNPYHRHHTQLMNGGGQEALCSSHFCEFESSLVLEFEFFQEIQDFGVL